MKTHLCQGNRRSLLIWLLSGALVLLAVACTALGGVSRKEAMSALVWDEHANAVQLRVQASPQLNRYAGQPHSLVLGVFQSPTQDALRNLGADANALRQALLTGKAPDDIGRVNRYIVMPGQERRIGVDRIRGSRWVGIAAGYADPGTTETMRIFEIPVTVSHSGWLIWTYVAHPATLRLGLDLGPDALQSARKLPPQALPSAPATVGLPPQG